MTKRKRVSRVPTRSSSQITQPQTTLESLEEIVDNNEKEEAHHKQPCLQSLLTNTVSSILYLGETYCYIKKS